MYTRFATLQTVKNKVNEVHRAAVITHAILHVDSSPFTYSLSVIHFAQINLGDVKRSHVRDGGDRKSLLECKLNRGGILEKG